MKDEGCPTCGSKNFGILEIENDLKGSSKWKMHCYNCNKFWYSSHQQIYEE
jgi:hypothetical protein